MRYRYLKLCEQIKRGDEMLVWRKVGKSSIGLKNFLPDRIRRPIKEKK